MQDTYYSQTSSSNTGLIILIFQSKDTPACFKTIKYLIFNRETRKDFLLFFVYTSLD